MSTVVYTDVGRVIQALGFQSPETLSSAASKGATSISISQPIPNDWGNGSTLVIDANNPSIRETVTITGINGQTISVTALTNAHSAGVPVANGTVVANYVSAASRWFDNSTFYSSGFAYEQVTDRKVAYLDNEGFIVVPLSKPQVDINDVMDVTFQSTPLDDLDELDISKAWIEDNYFLKILPTRSYTRKTGQATVVYNGGYNPVPDDIVQAVTVMAARFYKERDSGYSDVIGSAETGIMQYKKSAPADVQVVINKYRRWTE